MLLTLDKCITLRKSSGEKAFSWQEVAGMGKLFLLICCLTGAFLKVQFKVASSDLTAEQKHSSTLMFKKMFELANAYFFRKMG